MSMMVSFVLSFFPRDVLDEILNLIESVSEDFPSYSSMKLIQFRTIPLPCIVGFENNLIQMIIMTKQYVIYKNMSLGQRSMSQSALKLCA